MSRRKNPYYESNNRTMAADAKHPADRGHGHVRTADSRPGKRPTSPLLAKLLGGTGALPARA
jgi:hypothetical protein